MQVAAKCARCGGNKYIDLLTTWTVDHWPFIQYVQGVELKEPMELTKIKMLKEKRDQKWSEAWKKVNSTGIEPPRSSLPLYQCNASDDDDDDDDDNGGGGVSFS